MVTRFHGFNVFITLSACVAVLPLFLPTDAHAKTSQELVMQTRQCFANTQGNYQKEQQCRDDFLLTKRETASKALEQVKRNESYQQVADKQRQSMSKQ